MIIDFFLHSVDTGALLPGQTPTVTFCKRVDQDGTVTDIAGDVSNPEDKGGGLYRFTIDDALFFVGSVISYELDCGAATSEGTLTDHLSPKDVSQVVVPAEILSQADLTLKRGDLLPAFERVLLNERGGRLDLSGVGVTVQFKMRADGADVLKVDAAAEIVGDGKHGRVRYAWQGTDTNQAALYNAEFVVSSGPRSLPSSRFFRVSILSAIDD